MRRLVCLAAAAAFPAACQVFLVLDPPVQLQSDASNDGTVVSDAPASGASDAEAAANAREGHCDAVDGAALCLDFEAADPLGARALAAQGLTLTLANDAGLTVVGEPGERKLELDLGAVGARLAWSHPGGAQDVVRLRATVEAEAGASVSAYIGFMTVIPNGGEELQLVFQQVTGAGAGFSRALCAYRNVPSLAGGCHGLASAVAVAVTIEVRSQTVTFKAGPSAATVVDFAELGKSTSAIFPLELRFGPTYGGEPVRVRIDDVVVD